MRWQPIRHVPGPCWRVVPQAWATVPWLGESLGQQVREVWDAAAAVDGTGPCVPRWPRRRRHVAFMPR